MIQILRALWLITALVPGFAAAALYEAGRLRLLHCAAVGEPGAVFPAGLSRMANLIPGMSAADHFTGMLIFLPLMALVIIVPPQRVWAAVGVAVLWIAAVLVKLGLDIPTTCPETLTRPDHLGLFIWPGMLAAMILFRLWVTGRPKRSAA